MSAAREMLLLNPVVRTWTMTNSVNNTNNWTASLVSKQPICAVPKITGYKFVIKVECGGSQGMTFDVERTMMKDGSVCERSPRVLTEQGRGDGGRVRK